MLTGLLEQEFPLLKDQTANLLKVLSDVLNHYSLAYDSSSYEIGLPFKSGLEATLGALAEWHKDKGKA